MSKTERYYAAACQVDMPNPAHRDEISKKVERMMEMIDNAVVGYEPFFVVRLVVFPEFAHAGPVYPTVEELLDKLAVEIPNEHTERYEKRRRNLAFIYKRGHFLNRINDGPVTCSIRPV